MPGSAIRNLVIVLTVFLFVSGITGCAQAELAAQPSLNPAAPALLESKLQKTATPTGSPTAANERFDLQEPTLALTPRVDSAEIEPVSNALSPETRPALSAAPTPDLRLPPEDWQSWSIVPQRLSGELKALYQEGIRSGNRVNAFTKIGDCQNVSASFLGIYDRPGTYWFTEDFKFLEDTINQFSGSFNRDGQAVRGGFNVASVLSPMWADRQECLKGENPLECEFRLWRPGIVVISMETWFPGRKVDTYEEYLRQIVDFVLAHKAVPILATKADNTEGDHSINLAIARVAYEYDLPLWNFWLAVQPLEGHGLDWERDKDGFHITVEAWDKRSFTALQAIDAVWKMLNTEDNGAPSTGSETEPVNHTSTPTPTPTPEPASPEAIITLAPELVRELDSAESAQAKLQLIFNLGARVNGQENFSGLFLADIPEGQISLIPFTAPGYRLEALSPTGDRLLVSRANRLYLVPLDGSEPILLTENFLPAAGNSAAWIPAAATIAAVTRTATGTAVLLLNHRSDAEETLTAVNEQPEEIFPSYDGQSLVWGDGGHPARVYRTALDSHTSSELTGINDPVFSPDNIHWAYTQQTPDGLSILYLDSLGSPNPRTMRKIPGYYEHLSWSPDGKWLLAIETFQSGYSGRILRRKTWLFNAENLTSTLLSIGPTVFTHAAWSPDSRTIAFLGIEDLGGQQALRLQLLETRRMRVLFEQYAPLPWGEASEEGFVYLDRLGRLP